MLNPIPQLRIPPGRRQTSWLFTKCAWWICPWDHRGQIHSVVRVGDLNPRLSYSNPQLWPLRHAACLLKQHVWMTLVDPGILRVATVLENRGKSLHLGHVSWTSRNGQRNYFFIFKNNKNKLIKYLSYASTVKQEPQLCDAWLFSKSDLSLVVFHC